MPTIDAPLRIEIIDTAGDPPPEGLATLQVVGERPTGSTPGLVLLGERVVSIMAAGGPVVETWMGRSRARWTTLARRGHRARRWLARLAGDGNPRRDSAVRQHVFRPFDEVLALLPGSTTVVRAGSARLELSTPFAPLPGGVGVRASATLSLWGSWPALPVWITVEPWWRERTVAGVSLRTRRRLRYPRRYFGSAHAAVRAMCRHIEVGPERP